MNIEEIQNKIVDTFLFLDNWDDKYQYLIDLGKSLDKLPEIHKVEKNIIKGCQSKVWIYAYNVGDKLFFLADSDAIITRGIIALLIKVLSNKTPQDILNIDMSFLNKIGLKEHLSPTRANGLMSMVKQLKLYALAFSTKTNNDG